MDEAILVPSPNWFQVSGLRVSKDGWIIYGGPTKSLCILEPLQDEYKTNINATTKYRVHVFSKAHGDKIVSVDISPEWPEKRLILTGSADGSVKQWNIEKQQQHKKMNPTLSHEIHSHDKEEVAGVGYSTEGYAITVGGFGNLVKWDLKSNVAKTYMQLKNFKPVCMACSPHITLQVAVGTKQGVVFVLDLNDPAGRIIYKVRGQDEEILNLSWCPQYEVTLKKSLKESDKRRKKDDVSLVKESDSTNQNPVTECTEDVTTAEGDTSGLEKDLPDDSFDAVEIQDELFDIYKDHEHDEFGHKKYQPEDILVKVPKESEQTDYLADCLKLRDEILKRKNQAESSIESLVQALDQTHVDSANCQEGSVSSAGSSSSHEKYRNKQVSECSVHIHKHLLATISKFGSVRVWSKTGKLVSTCAVNTNKNQRSKIPFWPTLFWFKPDVLLLTDAKNQLLESNPLKIDCKNKLDWTVTHCLHKRGIYCISSNAPRVHSGNENEDAWNIWTVSQDRNIIQYSMSQRKKLSILASCGGFLYTVLPCSYDAGKLAVSVGDGAVRVVQSSSVENDESSFNDCEVATIWQNVQGKVLTVAWHPTKENLLAFATAESRIGLIDTSNKTEKPAKVLVPALRGSIYSISWGEDNELYACASGDLVVYHTNKLYDAPIPMTVEVEGYRWEVATVRHFPRALVVGNCAGAVALLTPRHPHTVLAAIHIFSKMIYMTDWHPHQTTNSSEESRYKNLLAVCSQDKKSAISILEYVAKEDGTKQLQVWKTLSGHRLPVFQVMWNPHHDAQLLSTSQDSTVRVWNAVEGVCTSIFNGHSVSCLGAAWCSQPQLSTKVLSGGGDCSLRLWDTRDYPADSYDEKLDILTKKDKKQRHKNKDKSMALPEGSECTTTEEQVAATLDTKVKGPKKFLLPITYRQTGTNCKLQGARLMLNKYLEKNSLDIEITDPCEDEYDLNFINMFGTINEVNGLLDKELENHESRNSLEAWMMVSIFRGHIDAMIQFASQRDLLCPYLLSIAPCVSYKYWKDATQLYLAQIDRFVAKGADEKLCDSKTYGGAVYRKVATLLSIHDVKGAVTTLTEAQLYMEAYILCRIRYMDSVAEQTLEQWAKHCVKTGTLIMAAVCYIALGNLIQAANILSQRNDQESLKLAADLAKIIGQKMLADHISERRENIMSNSEVLENTEEILKELPSKIEALMCEGKMQNGKANCNENGNESED